MAYITILLWVTAIIVTYMAVKDNDLVLLSASAVFLALLFTVLCIAMPVKVRRELREIETIRATIAAARESGMSDLERVKLLDRIIDRNIWLAEQKRDLDHWFHGPTVPEEVRDVKPLK